MEKAIEEVQELIRDKQGIESEPSNPDDIKKAINNLLWMYMPGEISIGDADTISMVVLDMIQQPNRYLKPSKR